MAEYEWAQITLGQNDKIAEVAAAAGKASALLNANLQFVKVSLELGKVLLLAAVNPQLVLLVAIADEIDNFVSDLKSTGFFVLEVTPTGMEVNPTDAEGNPVLLALSPLTLSANYAAAATAGLLTQFTDALVKNGITALGEVKVTKDPVTGKETKEIINATFPKAEYKVPIGKSLGDELLKKNADDDSMTLRDGVFGLSKMTPSQVIATMIAAMDDKLDEKRPQFSDSADVAAIIVVIGFADLTKNVPSLKEVLDLFLDFFGGENGLFTKGLQGIADIFAEIADELNSIGAHETEIVVQDICGVRGTIGDRKVLRQLIPDSQWNEHATDGSQYYYNYPAQFEIGNMVVGPLKEPPTGGPPGQNLVSTERAVGYVSNTIPAKFAVEAGTPYVTQTLTITCLSKSDKLAFEQFGAGALLQKVALFQEEGKHVDNNSMAIITDAPGNAYKLISNLTTEEAKNVAKVERNVGVPLLKITGTESVIEEYGSSRFESNPFTTKNWVQGRIGKSTEIVKKQAPPPNFKAVRLEELLLPLKEFFDGIQTFTDDMRSFAEGAIKKINKLTKYLEEKILELEELNKALQAILRIFTTGLPDSGVYSLSIPSTSGGNNAIKDALAQATNRPPDSLDYSVGFMMMGGAAAIDPLLSLIAG